MSTSSDSHTTLHETKLHIPFPSASDPKLHIVGILAQSEPFGPHHHSASSPSSSSPSHPSRQRRPLALMTHGVLAHKDQAYHRKLRDALAPLDSFRFDFRANHETPGEWNMSRFQDDVEDMECVLSHLLEEYGYEVSLVVGHSRGSLCGWKWFAERAQGRRGSDYGSDGGGSGGQGKLALWVSLGGRWDMSRIHDRDSLYAPQFEKQGFYIWKAKVAGQERQVKITPDQVEEFARYPIQEIVSRFPSEIDCLLLHGTADEVVPCPDVGYYLNALTSRSDRSAGQTQVHLVEGANHMFKGHHDEVVSVILQWYISRGGRRRGSHQSNNKTDDQSQQSKTPSSSPPKTMDMKRVVKDAKDLALEASQTGDVFEASWREKTSEAVAVDVAGNRNGSETAGQTEQPQGMPTAKGKL